MPNYVFHMFDLHKIALGSVVNVIGKRGSGKSVFITDIMYTLRDQFPVVTVVSTTDKLNHTFSTHVPEMLIHDKYESCIIEKILDRQRSLVQRKNLRINPNLLLILDDIQGTTRAIRTDTSLDTIYTTGRHFKVTFISAMQYVNGLSPTQRSNTDYICLSRDNNLENQKKLFQAFAGMFNNFKEFQSTFMRLTENNGIMIINNREQSMDIEKCVFWYRVDMSKPDFANFKMCSPKVWQAQEELAKKVSRKTTNRLVDVPQSRR